MAEVQEVKETTTTIVDGTSGQSVVVTEQVSLMDDGTKETKIVSKEQVTPEKSEDKKTSDVSIHISGTQTKETSTVQPKATPEEAKKTTESPISFTSGTDAEKKALSDIERMADIPEEKIETTAKAETAKASSVTPTTNETETKPRKSRIGIFIAGEKITLAELKARLSRRAVKAAETKVSKNAAEIEEISADNKEACTYILAAHDEGIINDDKALEIGEEYSTEEVTKAVAEEFPTKEASVSSEKIAKIRKRLAHSGRMHALLATCIADKKERQEDKEKFLEKAAARSERYSGELMYEMTNALPEDCSKEVTTAVLDTADSYATSKIDAIKTFATNRHYSEKFFDTLNKIADRIHESIKEKKAIIIKYLENKKAKLERAKANQEVVVKKRTENMEIAKETAAKSKSMLKYYMELAAKSLRWFGLQDLKIEDKKKVIKKKEPRLGIDLKYQLLRYKWDKEEAETCTLLTKKAESKLDRIETSIAFTNLQLELV